MQQGQELCTASLVFPFAPALYRAKREAYREFGTLCFHTEMGSIVVLAVVTSGYNGIVNDSQITSEVPQCALVQGHLRLSAALGFTQCSS